MTSLGVRMLTRHQIPVLFAVTVSLAVTNSSTDANLSSFSQMNLGVIFT